MIKPPLSATLKKYGLTAEMWMDLVESQDYACPICERKFNEKIKPVTDHFHVRNYKKMSPEKKRLYIRGITCAYCNQRRLYKGITSHTAYNTWSYLLRFERKLKDNESNN